MQKKKLQVPYIPLLCFDVSIKPDKFDYILCTRVNSKYRNQLSVLTSTTSVVVKND